MYVCMHTFIHMNMVSMHICMFICVFGDGLSQIIIMYMGVDNKCRAYITVVLASSSVTYHMSGLYIYHVTNDVMSMC